MGRHSAPSSAALPPPVEPVPSGPRHAAAEYPSEPRVDVPGPLDSSALYRPARHLSALEQPGARHLSALEQPVARHRPALEQPARHRSALDQPVRRHSAPEQPVAQRHSAPERPVAQRPSLADQAIARQRSALSQPARHRHSPDEAGRRPAAGSQRRSAAARAAGSHRVQPPVVVTAPKAPLWRRSPAVPAAVAVIAVWSGANAPHLLPAGHAGPLGTANGVKLDLSALGVGNAAPAGAATRAADNSAADSRFVDSRVSRTSRTLPGRGTDAAAPGRTLAPKPAAKPAAKAKPAPRWVRPSAGAESSCFCMRWGVMHDGIDLAGPLGSPIVAVGDGVVVEAGPASGFGLWVVIQHPNGDYSIYGHMYTYYVSVGQHVKAGQHIADIGANGQSTGPHLHFGVAQGSPMGPYLDPVPWLAARGIDIGAYDPDA